MLMMTMLPSEPMMMTHVKRRYCSTDLYVRLAETIRKQVDVGGENSTTLTTTTPRIGGASCVEYALFAILFLLFGATDKSNSQTWQQETEHNSNNNKSDSTSTTTTATRPYCIHLYPRHSSQANHVKASSVIRCTANRKDLAKQTKHDEPRRDEMAHNPDQRCQDGDTEGIGALVPLSKQKINKKADPTGVYSPLKVSKSVPANLTDMAILSNENPKTVSHFHECSMTAMKPKTRTEALIHSMFLEKMSGDSRFICPGSRICEERLTSLS